LLAALRRNLTGPAAGPAAVWGPASIWGHHAGLHLSWFPVPETGSPADLAALARLCGLEAAALPAGTDPRAPAARAVLLGFGTLPERQIEQRVVRFAGLIQTGRLLPRSRSDEVERARSSGSRLRGVSATSA